MTQEKSRRRKIPRQELVVPDEGNARSGRRYKKMVQQYQSAIEDYRTLATEFHKNLLRPKDFPGRDK